MGWTSLECECGASIIGPSTIARPCCSGPCRMPRSTRCSTSTASMCKARWVSPSLDLREVSCVVWVERQKGRITFGQQGEWLTPDALPDSWQVAVRNVPMTGSISQVLVQLPHVFQRMEAESLASVIDARYPHPQPFPLDPGSPREGFYLAIQT